ncbi:MAG: FAD-dependent oxidoreductase [Planctomycetaceae bacterium]|nr:FAD-dependent oxidoreductase [Planctomycetaceae bacterium]
MTTKPLRIVIIGGVAGGASAATRARRMNEAAEIVLLEKDDEVSFANCGLPYYLGGEIAVRGKLLVATAEFLRRRFKLDVRTRHEARRIDPNSKCVEVFDHHSQQSYQLEYDKLILAPGAAPLTPSLEGLSASGVFTLRNMSDTDRIHHAIGTSAGKRAAVIGSGFIGLEMVEQLQRRGFQVSLAELQPHVLPILDPEMSQPLMDELAAHGVSVHVGDGIQKVMLDRAGGASGVMLASGKVLDADLVILGLGVRPQTQLAVDAGLQIGASGGIATNRWLQSSDPHIYAVGDAAEYPYGPTGTSMRVALAGPANRAGRLAGEHAATGQCAPMASVFGTSIVRVFELSVGITGLSAASAKRFGIPSRSVTVIANHHAGYYPGAQPLTLKLTYSPEDGRILGAQAIGREGVDKRLDVVATAMAFRGTVRDLAGLDLAYAPPFGSAKDPIHQAAFAASNQLDGLEDFIDADADLTGLQVVDVRTTNEVRDRPLTAAPQAINIPLDELRTRYVELDRSARTVVSCGVGVRGHVAARILRQLGFHHVQNLTGGATLRARAVPSR